MGSNFIEQKHYVEKINTRERERERESNKFQFSVIFLISFCNYSLFFLNLKYLLNIKGI